jgi:hypothetical protein
MTSSLSSAESWAFFPGFVPPFIIFSIYVENLEEIVTSPQQSQNTESLVPRLCVIGLLAYFEAFCKGQFASVVNVCPSTLRNFVQRRNDVSIKVKDFLHVTEHLEHRLGSVLAEEYDFGSAKLINGLFCDLINRSPFSTRDAKVYSQLLSDRNLLVHHGGAYTLKYSYQKFASHEVPSKVFDYEIEVGVAEFTKAASFLKKIATKLTVTCHDALVKFVHAEGLSMNEAQQHAIESMLDGCDLK